MKQRSEMPSIYAYNDFRKYLAVYQAARMATEKNFTKSEFSRQLDLPNTRSYFNDVLKGKTVTGTFIERFIRVIGFSREEAQFFRTLVRFNQADSVEERELSFTQLIDLNRTPGRILTKKMLEYYGNWYNSVLRALLEIEDFRDDFPALVRKIRPTISVPQAKKAVALLLELGLVEKKPDGTLKPSDKAIRAPELFRNELIRHYQLEVLSLTREKMAGTPEDITFSFTNTISLSERGWRRLQTLADKFRSQVRSLVHKDEERADRVVQLALVLTNLTNREKS